MALDQLNGLLLPGTTCSVQCSVQVDKKTAQLLNAGKDVRNEGNEGGKGHL